MEATRRKCCKKKELVNIVDAAQRLNKPRAGPLDLAIWKTWVVREVREGFVE